jgi:hypothetical protein
MKLRIVTCLSLLITGLIVLAWPEEDNLMMVQLSKLHGPSTLDLIGIAIILAGYFPLILPVFTRFSLVQQRIGKRSARYLVMTVALFSCLIAAALVVESELLLWSSVAISTAAQTLLVFKTY